MATYYPITEEEMEDFLLPRGFRRMHMPGVNELVYGKRVDEPPGIPLTLRIFTGIDPFGNSRESGQDAIRVVCYAKKILTPEEAMKLKEAKDVEAKGNAYIFKVSGSKRVHRVEGWRKNLSARIEKCVDDLGPPCRKCGYPTIKRAGKFGKDFFYGCASYPVCNGYGDKEWT